MSIVSQMFPIQVGLSGQEATPAASESTGKPVAPEGPAGNQEQATYGLPPKNIEGNMRSAFNTCSRHRAGVTSLRWQTEVRAEECKVHVSAAEPLTTPKRQRKEAKDESPLVPCKRIRCKTTPAEPEHDEANTAGEAACSTLSAELRAKVEKAVAVFGAGEQGNCLKKKYSPSEVPKCEICMAKRHEVKWQVRVTGNGKTKASGSQCYGCYRASVKLQCPRSRVVCQASHGNCRSV